MGQRELSHVLEAFETNWIAPVGPHVDAFENEFADRVGATFAVALSSGTAALHLALREVGVGVGDEVLVSTLTFCASVNPILYERGVPVLIDSEYESWNLDPNLVEDALRMRARRGRLPKALVAVHLYGQAADLDPICQLCDRYGVALIEDAAEALGATYKGRSPGVFGSAGVYSFNGNKIITTSGGGMLVTEDEHLARHVKKVATQSREPAPHYEHKELGYNYRLSNVLAGIGRGQLTVLDSRVRARQRVFDRYKSAFSTIPGLDLQTEATWGRSTRWLSCMTVDSDACGATSAEIITALADRNIEARPLWKPMHLQPYLKDAPKVGGIVSETLFRAGVCLPSGSSMTEGNQDRVIAAVLELVQAKANRGV